MFGAKSETGVHLRSPITVDIHAASFGLRASSVVPLSGLLNLLWDIVLTPSLIHTV